MHRPTPRTYRLALGINLDAAPILQTRWRERYFPLDNALVDITDEAAPHPAWFTKLHAGDHFSIRLVDITSILSPNQPPFFPALLDLFFTAPRTGEARSPFTEPPARWTLAQRATPRWSPVYSRSTRHELSTWEIRAEAEGGLPIDLTFAEVEAPFEAFQLSVMLRVEREPYTDYFVFDPEMIVSDIDVPPLPEADDD
ncbi:MAG: hypothetical protein AAGC60_08295 [Acidobacteriota bacterium]